MADRTIFQCPICHTAITQPLSPLKADVFVCLEDGKPLVPQGFFIGSLRLRQANEGHGNDLLLCNFFPNRQSKFL
jgi:hypothetical protein